MEGERRAKRTKRRMGGIIRLLLLAAIIILGVYSHRLGVFQALGLLVKENAEGALNKGRAVWENWEGVERDGEERDGEEKDGAYGSGGGEAELGPDSVILSGCAYLDQKELGFPTGCELVTAAMALQTEGVDISAEEFLGYVPREELYQENGTTYGPAPWEAFVGNPFSSSGFGCFAPVIKKAAEGVILDRGAALQVKDMTGSTLEELKEEIDRGSPVILWASMGMEEITYKNSWHLEGRKTPFFWPGGEHCLLMVGYERGYLFFNDPMAGELVAYRETEVEAVYEELGSQALVIRSRDS